MIKKAENNWSYEEFHAFVMLYAANADSQITPEEEDQIIPTLSKEQYENVKKSFKKCSDSEALDVILSYRDQYFPTQKDRAEIIADMQRIYKADNIFSQIERGVDTLFRKIFK
jgi:hypothetical protein